MGAAGMRHVADMLSVNKSITSLDVRDNCIATAGLAHIAQVRHAATLWHGLTAGHMSNSHLRNPHSSVEGCVREQRSNRLLAPRNHLMACALQSHQKCLHNRTKYRTA
jgi:hypothetical protein